MIFASAFFTEMLLPFLLVFVVVFAILQKSKIFGEGKAQIDSLVALVIALILIAFPQPRDIVVGIMPWLAVGIAVILVFLILYGFVAGDLSKNFPKGLKITFGILAGIFVIGVVIYVTGLWRSLKSMGAGEVWGSIFFIAVIIGAVIWVVVSSSGNSNSGSSD